MILSNNCDYDLLLKKASYAFALAGDNKNYTIKEDFSITATTSDRAESDTKIISILCKTLENTLYNFTYIADTEVMTRLTNGVIKFTELHVETCNTIESRYLLSFLLSAASQKSEIAASCQPCYKFEPNCPEIDTILTNTSKKSNLDQRTDLYNELKFMYLATKLSSLVLKIIAYKNDTIKSKNLYIANCKNSELIDFRDMNRSCGIKISDTIRLSCKEMQAISEASSFILRNKNKKESGENIIKALVKLKYKNPLISDVIDQCLLGIRHRETYVKLIEKTKKATNYNNQLFAATQNGGIRHYCAGKLFALWGFYEIFYEKLSKDDEDEIEDVDSVAQRTAFITEKYQFVQLLASQVQEQLIKFQKDDLSRFATIQKKLQSLTTMAANNKKERQLLLEGYSKVGDFLLADYPKIAIDISYAEGGIVSKTDKISKDAVSAIKSREKQSQKSCCKAMQKLSLAEPIKPATLEPSISYHARVSRWWGSDNDPFIHDPSYNQKSYSAQAKAWIKAEHNFALAVDGLLNTEGICFKNQKSLIGEISLNGETKQGIFTYTFDKNSICYHRYFSSKTPHELITGYVSEGFYELNFPAYETAPFEGSITPSITGDDSSISVIKNRVIIIDDPKNGATIRICRFH